MVNIANNSRNHCDAAGGIASIRSFIYEDNDAGQKILYLLLTILYFGLILLYLGYHCALYFKLI